jgi:hypothetical protein
LSLNPADKQQLSWWINDVQKLWITNPAIADNPVLEGTKIGKLLVRHASAMPQDRDFLLDDYLPTQWIAGKFLAELNRVSGDEMLHIYRPYIAAVLAVFDAFGKREEALRRGTLRVEFEKN